jgi:hypothetical protein
MISVYLLQKKLFQQTKQITNATQQINAQQSEGKASYSVFLFISDHSTESYFLRYSIIQPASESAIHLTTK